MRIAFNKEEFGFKRPEMLSYHTTWDDADYEPALPRPRRSGVAKLVTVPVRWMRNYAERRRTMNELAKMSDRDLADLGLSRYDIPRVFDPAFAAERDPRI